MKNIYDFLMKILFSVSLGLFFVLGILVVFLGPAKTEHSIKSFFDIDKYLINFQKISPTLSENNQDEESDNSSSVLGVKREIIDLSSMPPLLVPSSGIAPRAFFLYTGSYADGGHEGIDIWTNTAGKGMDNLTYYKGNPVYASCSGKVRKILPENGDVSIICDPLPEIYKDVVPSLYIKTLYGHMADKQTKDVFIYVKEGQYVNKGDLIGHQGNLSMYAPENLMVHLHFGIYDITNVQQVPLDPTPYIGVSCTTLNQEFVAGVEE